MSNDSPVWVYTDIVKDHFIHPRNVWEDDAWPAQGVGLVGSMACGDQMKVGIIVEDDKIVDIKWQTYGCASAIASTSMMSEMVIGFTLEEAYKLSPKTIDEKLGGLPKHKFHCSVLGDKALRAAIDDYLEKEGRDNPYRRMAAKIICECKNVTDVQIEDLVKSKQATTLDELRELTEYGTVCGKCQFRVQRLFDELLHIYEH